MLLFVRYFLNITLLIIVFCSPKNAAECFVGCTQKYCQYLVGSKEAKCCLARALTIGGEQFVTPVKRTPQLVPNISRGMFMFKIIARGWSGRQHPDASLESLPVTFFKKIDERLLTPYTHTNINKRLRKKLYKGLVPQLLLHKMIGESISDYIERNNLAKVSSSYQIGEWERIQYSDGSYGYRKYDSAVSRYKEKKTFLDVAQEYSDTLGSQLNRIKCNPDEAAYDTQNHEKVYRDKLGYRSKEEEALVRGGFLEGFNSNIFNIGFTAQKQLSDKYEKALSYSGTLPYDLVGIHVRAKQNKMPLRYFLLMEQAFEAHTLQDMRSLASLLNFWDPREELCLVRIPKGAEIVASFGLVGPQRNYYLSDNLATLSKTWFLFADDEKEFEKIRKRHLYSNADASMGGAVQLAIHAISKPCDVLSLDLWPENEWPDEIPVKDRFFVRKKTPYEINKILRDKMASMTGHMRSGVGANAESMLEDATRISNIHSKWKKYYDALKKEHVETSYIWWDPQRLDEAGMLHLTDERYNNRTFALEKFLCQRVPKGGDKPILSTQACKKIQHLLQKPACDCEDD